MIPGPFRFGTASASGFGRRSAVGSSASVALAGTGSVGTGDDLPPEVGVWVTEVHAAATIMMVDPTGEDRRLRSALR